MNSQSPYLKWFLLSLLAIIWGSSFILIKKGLVSYNFIEAASIRMMSAGLAFILFAVPHIKRIPIKKYPYVFMAAIFGMFLPAYLFCLAQQHVQSVVAGLLNALTPAFAFVFSIFIFKSKYKSKQIIGLTIGLISAMALAFERSGTEISFNYFAILIVIATISYGFNINMVKNKLQDVSSMSLSYISVSMAGILAFFFFFLPNRSTYHFDSIHSNSLVALICLGVFGTAIAQILYYKLIKMTTPLFTSTVTFLIPIVALMWGIWDGEQINIVHLLCIIGILTGVTLIRKS